MDNKKLLQIIQSGQQLTITHDRQTNGLMLVLSDTSEKKQEFIIISEVSIKHSEFDALDYSIDTMHQFQLKKANND